jgi:fibronectin type 3 domain-containing protein|uniref:Fibronectin type-III domain-containing protein n=1 Tax=Desulfobacca acetoxidans TaxID=60893 RepID=A0A7C3WQF1_9BACT
MPREFLTFLRKAGELRPRALLSVLPVSLTLFILIAACGKKMDPLPPEAVLPGPVKEFSLVQEGEGLLLSWQFPTENQLGQPLTQLSGFRLERCETKELSPPLGCLVDFIVVADIELDYPRVGQVKDGSVFYRDHKLTPGRRYYYRVAAYDPSRYPGAWSRVLSHAWGVLPQTPQQLEAEAGDRQVVLSWSPVTRLKDGSPARDLAGYYVYRRAAGGDWTRITPALVTDTAFRDVTVKNDVEYTYMVRAVRQVGPDRLESLDSPTRTVKPEDLTPPPPVLNLVAAITAKGVELRWDDSPAPDLAGYRVYRRRAGEAHFTRLTPELLKKPYYVDTRVSRGQTYYYYVIAVDNSRRANESLPSEETVVNYQL